MKSRSKQQKEFCGKLKDPYYGRPVIVKEDAPIGAIVTLSAKEIGETGKVIQFLRTHSNKWFATGDAILEKIDCKTFSDIEFENLLKRFWTLSNKLKLEIMIEDQQHSLWLREPADAYYI